MKLEKVLTEDKEVRLDKAFKRFKWWGLFYV